MKNVAVVLLLGYFSLLSAQSLIRIGTLTDGSNPEWSAQRDTFVSELAKVAEGEFVLRFPQNKQLSGNFSVDATKRQIDMLENDPDVDMVLLIGGISSQLALSKNNLRKPTFAPFIYNVTLSGLTQSGNFSSIKNLNYLTDESTLQDEIRTFQRIVPFRHLLILADESQYRLFSKTTEQAIRQSQQDGVELSFLTVGQSDDHLVSKIPPNIDAVMLAPLPRLSEKDKQILYAGLIERKLPTYALGESSRVKEGILLSQTRSSDTVKRARSTGLNMLAVMRGDKAEKQPVVFAQKRSLYINMATARSIGIFPQYKVLENAVVINSEEEKEPKLTFDTVAKEALHANLGIIAGQLGVESNLENVAEVRSVLFPHIIGELSYSQLNRDNVYVENGFYAEKSASGALKVQQILFSEKALANLEIQKELHIAVEEQQRTLELEVIKQASTMFLNMLVAQTQYRIQTDNLTLTRNNLELAKGRVEAGTTDMSDVYYWESAIAAARQNVLYAKAEVDKAKDALNRILNRNIGDRFAVDSVSMDDPAIRKNLDALLEMLTDENRYNSVEKFLVEEGLSHSGELRQLSAQLSAQKRQLLSEERAYYSPDVVMAAEASHVFDETRNKAAGISLEDKTDWQAGVKLTFPLYEGGGRSARNSRARLNLQQTQVRYNDTKQSIEQRIRSDLHTIGASYPSIALAAEAAMAARKSFEIVRENYAQGTRSMSDLLTAQNNTLVAEQSATNTLYRFMIDTLQLQRDISNFDLLLDDTKQTDLVTRMRESALNVDMVMRENQNRQGRE